MQEELRRSNAIGTASAIEHFFELVFTNKSVSIESLHNVFRYHSLTQFNCHLAILFLEELGLIKIHSKEIHLTASGEGLSGLTLDCQKKRISTMVLNLLLEEKMVNCERFSIDSITGELKIPANAFSLSAAVYRNFLYEIGYFSKHGVFFVISDEKLRKEFESRLAEKKKKTSQAELLLKLQKQQEDGELGERFVLKYETKRLSQFRKLPKLISPIDVGAGYDILSYNGEESTNYDRYIEVKSFRGKPHFFWSANEKRIAELFGENYFLYLVDLCAVEKSGEAYIPQVIQNPATNLNSDNWLIEPSSYLITLL